MYFRDSTARMTTTLFPATGTKGRFAYLDVLRGALLVVMAINHVPSDLHVLTDHFFGYMSAAEGFVFLAGLMAGLVYTRMLLRSGREEVRRASFRLPLLRRDRLRAPRPRNSQRLRQNHRRPGIWRSDPARNRRRQNARPFR